jgi:hypothetical protein
VLYWVYDRAIYMCQNQDNIVFSLVKLKNVNKLIEELSTIALAEFDIYTRFKAMAVTGNPEAGLRILDKLDHIIQ